jgi:hypothetical protein
MKTLTLAAIISVTLVACRKPFPDISPIDGTAPVVTINGNLTYSQPAPATPYTGTWTNPTATANDNLDGDVSASIVVIGSVNPNITGTYHLYYVAHDSHNNYGTTAVTVTIGSGAHVAPYLAGYYNCADTCGITSPYTYNSTWTCDNVINNKVVITNFEAFGNSVNVNCMVDGQQQTLSFVTPFNVGPGVDVLTASGTYTHAGNSVQARILTHWTTGSFTDYCVGHYNK